MAYSDPNATHNPATGTVAPATWGDVIRDDLEFLIDPPACSISAAAVTAATGTLIILGTTNGLENFDNDAMHSDSTNRSRITIQTAGRYLFLSNAFTDNVTGSNSTFLRTSFRIDGTTAIGGSQIKNANATTEAIRLTAARSLVLSAGQYVEATFQQNLGGDVQITLDEFVAVYLTR